MSDTAVLAPDSAPIETPPPKRRAAWWKRLLAGLLVLVLLVLLLIGWLAGTESGLRFAATRLPSWFGVDVSAEKLEGTLWRGFQGSGIQVATEGTDLSISSLQLQWQPQALWQRQLHIQRLAAGDIHIQGKPTPPRESSPPPQLPQSIDLPLGVQVDSLEVGRISSGRSDTTLLLPSSISYAYDHQQHRLQVVSLNTPWQNFKGEVSLDTAPPFALAGNIEGDGELEGHAASSDIVAHGSLESPDLLIQLKSSNEVHLVLRGVVRPFEAQLNRKIVNLNFDGRNINPQAFGSNLPKADLVFNLALEPAAQTDTLSGLLELQNDIPAAINDNGIPVKRLDSQLSIDSEGKLQLQDTVAELTAGGRIDFGGHIDTVAQTLALEAKVQQFKLRDILRQDYLPPIDGTITGSGSFDNPEARWQLNAGKTVSTGLFQLLTDREGGQQTLKLSEVSVKPENGGALNAEASLALFQQQAVQAKVDSLGFNPGALDPRLPAGSVNGKIDLDGHLADGSDLKLDMVWKNSRLSGAPLSGQAKLQYRDDHLPQADIDLTLGRNHILAKGSFGKAGDRLNLNINAPNLDLFGFGLKGYLQAQGFVAGEPSKLSIDLNGQANGLAVGNSLQVSRLGFNLKGSPDLGQPLNIQLDGRQIHVGTTQIDTVNLQANGSGRNHSLQGNGSLSLDGKPYRLNLAAAGGLSDQYQWQGRVNQLDIGGAFNLRLLNPIRLEAGAERVQLNDARWSAMRGSLNLQSFSWEAQRGITTRGSATGLHLEELNNLLDIGGGDADQAVKQNLVVNGDWDINYSQNATGYLNLQQQGGDVVMSYRQQALGLNNIQLATRFQSGRIDNRLTGQTRYGSVDAAVAISQTFGDKILLAPISGYLKAQIPDLDAIRNLMPIGMSAKGSLQVDTVVSGSVGEPRLNGTANGSNLYYRDRNTGVILDNGSLTSRFQGRDWLVDSLAFRRKDGSVELKGRVNLTGTTPDVDVNAVFNRYPILDTPNRKLTLSGDSRLLYTPQRGITLSGTLKADSGHFGFQKSGMPTLDDDVVVLGEEQTVHAEAPTPIALNLVLDLNDSFRFSGEGLDVMLGGQLTMSAQPKEDIRAVGTVNIVRGQYKAYGQDLVIDKGTISFVGPLSDPNLNLRATRKLSPVGAGVEVLGSLNNPRVSLVANEPMSDKDKLSWLILGRASSGNESDEATVAAAASAFLVGNINDKIGLVDDFGMTTRRTRNTQTGELNPAEQIITFGKRLTNELYLGYEYSITSANQAVKLIWQINSSLQAIGRVGTDSVGGEVRYIIRFD